MCDIFSGNQDNWLITQFISNILRQPDVYIRVTYAYLLANFNCPFFGCTTDATVHMYVLQTNEVNQSYVRNVNMFESQQPVAALTDTIRDGITTLTRTVRISADLSTSGLYVGFRDIGACMDIYEVVVYYPICDSISLELGADFPINELPGNSFGSCFTNMAINPNTPNIAATCTVRLSQNELFTNWIISNGSSRCMCLPGYRFTSPTTIDQCEGMYVATLI